MSEFDPVEFGRAVGDMINDAVSPLIAKIESLEAELAEVKAYKPVDGKDADIADLIPAMESAVERAVSAIPAPQDGKDAEPVDVDAIKADLVCVVKDTVASAMAAIPAPEKGRDGADGVTLDEVKAWVADHVETKQAVWELDFERRAHGALERAVDRMPKPRDGADGKSFDGVLSKTTDDAGNGRIVHRWFVGDQQVGEHDERQFIDRGVWRDDVSDYLKFNGVTFGGSFWIAQKDAPEGKPGLSSDWRLAVKKGRDSRD